jgi:hypothetical protein
MTMPNDLPEMQAKRKELQDWRAPLVIGSRSRLPTSSQPQAVSSSGPSSCRHSGTSLSPSIRTLG